ncbi:hypothetical protein Saga11_19180 [Bacillus safensis]|nr:hypothetical protein Saga11_19180 [Bacillus safensis]
MNGDIWKGTTVGNGLNVLLPGQYIKSYSKDGSFLYSSGTSMAAAYTEVLLLSFLKNILLIINPQSLKNMGKNQKFR